jgi:uncharacterized protein YdiU (UPF0061 family)
MSTSTPVAGGPHVGWRFENSYAGLPEVFHSPAAPARVREPRLTILNSGLARELGLDFSGLGAEATAEILAGQRPPKGTQPIAQAYAGHQFGGFTMLGDGRAILLGEHRTPSGALVDIQLKGSGRTRFSRGGDGLAALGPMLREYIISEAMAALGIPTTRSLAVVTTGEPVYRESIRRGAVLTRVAASHIRVGTFEYAVRLGEDAVRQVADYAIERHDPELADRPAKYLEFFKAVVDRQASLIARWLQVGFIHGVMNTDNMAISGETIDYGPCAFMNVYDPGTVFSSIDRGGRYAYSNQPHIAQWNLARFAETLLALFDPDTEKAVPLAMAVLNDYPRQFEAYWLAGMRRKLGLLDEQPGDLDLIQSLLTWMEQSRADFTNTFRDLSEAQPPEGERYQNPQFHDWYSAWNDRLASADRAEVVSVMKSVNPAVIPRNHRVEEALQSAEENDDLTPLHRLLEALANPFESRPEFSEYREAPEDESGYRTFCGT